MCYVLHAIRYMLCAIPSTGGREAELAKARDQQGAAGEPPAEQSARRDLEERERGEGPQHRR